MFKHILLKFVLFSFIIFCSGCSFQNNENSDTNIFQNINEKLVNENNNIEKNFETKNSINEHPLDIELGKCIEKDSTNSGMINCGYIAADGWNNEIKKHLNNLKTILTPEQFAVVQDSQDKWEEYKNKELITLKKLVFEHDGRYYQVAYVSEYVGLLKERATLLGYYEYLYSEVDN